MSPDIDAYFLLFLGFIVFVAGLGNVLLYPNPKLTGLNMFLIVLGIVSVIFGGVALHQQINRALTYLRGQVYCIDCQSYVGLYEATLTRVDGKPIVHQKPRFSNGMCISKGMLIEDGFHQRRCPYFVHRKS